MFFWAGPDDLDLPAPDLGYPTQLYNLDAAGYESLMLGLFAIHRGPPNGVCWKGRFPKLTELCVGFSRDGFHWHRPDRRSFIGASRKEGTWNQAYVLSAGGCCLVVGDKLYFYSCAFSGESPKLGRDMYAGGSTGLATPAPGWLLLHGRRFFRRCADDTLRAFHRKAPVCKSRRSPGRSESGDYR